ncbi:MAG: sn-glycerol-3-phosphate ABC transporter ATP-binding protein UgpC [Candidatus Brocadiaceae bacterium]|nr:sn-glycerol-3-phosphate ABC transporter ATP-binding protein UgpC [Candidatus Brocadiaceae bacterium]
MAEVKFENVCKVYDGGVKAVNDVNLTVEDGSLLVLVGPSGCGKSTTLRMVAGLEDITSGRVSIGGQVVNNVLPKDRDIAMVFQNYALYPHMTVYNNMAFGLRLRGYATDEIDRRVRHAAELLEIDALLKRRPRELSGGQAQRVAVGRAIVRQPKVFLFDEPLSNLDAKLRVQMRVEIARLHERLGATMIYVTHDQVEAMTLGSRVAVMRDGYVLQVDAPLGLYDHPVNRFVGGFIGSPPMNFIDGTIERREGGLAFASDDVTLTLTDELASCVQGCIGKAVSLGIRPEDLHDSALFTEGPPENVADLHVEVVEPLGAETLVYLRGRTQKHDIVAKVDPRSRMRVNDQARIAFDLRKAHIFDGQSEDSLTRRVPVAPAAS